MLATTPCLPTTPTSRLSNRVWNSVSHGRDSLRTSVRPAVVRITCCSGATPIVEAVDVSQEVGSATSARFGDVYVASVPLRAPKLAQEIFEAVKDLEMFSEFQHFMTIVKPVGNGDLPCTVLDFQPQNPEDPMTVLSVLIGNSIPGVILERTLSRLPNQRCWWVGEMKPGLSLEDAVKFSRGYSSELSLGINDCRHHTLDLVEYLTGTKMNHIEEVRTVKERQQRMAEELKNNSTQSSEESMDLEDVN